MKNHRGFSILELIMALAIGLIILAALAQSLIIQQRIYHEQETAAAVVQTGRAAIDMMAREIRMAGFDPTKSFQHSNPSAGDFCGIVYDPDYMMIMADYNGNGILGEQNEIIIYRQVSDRIERFSGGAFYPFAENIRLFEFKFFKSDGQTEIKSFNESGSIRYAKIKLIVASDRPGEKAEAFESLIKIRNLNLRR